MHTLMLTELCMELTETLYEDIKAAQILGTSEDFDFIRSDMDR